MSSTNKTTNYNLSQFVGTDVPSYLGDYNGDMSKIDKAIGDVANSQGSVEQSVVGLTAEVQGLSTQVDGFGTSLQQVQTSVSQIDTAYKQADTALSQRITTNANNIQTNTTAIESTNTAIESINTTIGTEDISGIGDGTIKGAISNINSSLTVDLTNTSLPADTTFNELIKKLSEKVFPKTMYLIKNGDMNVTFSTKENGSISNGNGYIVYSRTGATNGFESDEIDLTGFSSLKAEIQNTSDSPNFTIGVGSSYYNPEVSKSSGISTARMTLTVDISSITGTKKVVGTIGNSTGSTNIYNVWLE